MADISKMNVRGAIYIKTIERYRCLIQCLYCGKQFEMWTPHFYRGSNPCRCQTQRIKRISSIYMNMHTRCYNPKYIDYKDYGGRGITICEEWHNYNMFEQWALQNGYDDELQIDRIDVNKGYSPENCRWVNPITQANNKTNNILFVVDGVKISLRALCKKLHINYKTMHTKYREHDFDYDYILNYLCKTFPDHDIREYIHEKDYDLPIVS